MIKKLNRLWRIVATGLCFSLFGLGGLVLSLTVLPLQRLIYKDTQQQKQIARLTVHYAFRFFTNTMRLVGAFTLKIEGAEKLSQLKGKVVIANHPSLIDVVILIAQIKNADCVVKNHLFKNPFIRGVITASGYISNSDPDQLINDCSQSLASGNNLVIFPEGTRTTPNTPLKLQRGFANIALRSNADLVFILIDVNPSTLTKDNVWYNVPDRRFTFLMQVKQNISIAPYQQQFGENTTKAVRQLSRDIGALFKKELNQNE